MGNSFQMNMFEEYALLVSAIALSISLINLILYYKQIRRTTVASIKHELTNLPPYGSTEDTTTITVKNVGNSIAEIRDSCLFFSWNEDLTFELDYGCGENEIYQLFPNEEKTFHKKLQEPPSHVPEKGYHTITIVTNYDKYTKIDEFPIRARKKGFFISSK